MATSFDYAPLVVALTLQMVLGVVFLIGFVAVMKRFMDKEVPALLQAANEKLARVELRIERMSGELSALALKVAQTFGDHGARLDALERARGSEE